MANTFKNSVAAAVGTSLTTIHTVPSATTTALIGLSLANITNSSINVNVLVTDVSTSTTVYLVKNAPIPAGSSLVVIGGDQKVILETGDQLKVSTDTASAADVFLSRMEMT